MICGSGGLLVIQQLQQETQVGINMMESTLLSLDKSSASLYMLQHIHVVAVMNLILNFILQS